MSSARFLLLLACTPTWIAAQSSGAAAREAATPRLRIGTTRTALRVDGRLSESEWATADSIDGLTQVEPRQGETPSGHTVVRVLASEDAIYVGVHAYDQNAARMVSFSRARDSDLKSEDHVKIVLDTYRDGRSGYVFAVNPNAARYDALVANRGEGEDSNWDAVWEAATQRTADGWTLEVRIPVRSLLYRQGLSTWGLNVERRMQRLQETSRWASASQDFKSTYTSRAGLLTDIPAFHLGLGLSVRPSVTASLGYPSASAQADHQQDLSLDATQRIGANSLGSLTLNTDFAETEVDTRRTNLTRFPLLFPEKRTFFLEGSDIFDFGIGLREDVRPFFSRSIGLLSESTVPIIAGTKVNGRLGGTSFGALGVRTGSVDGLTPANNMGVVRIKQNVFRESTLGLLATAGDPRGIGGAWMAGTDYTYQTSHFRGSKNFLVGLWGVTMGRDTLAGAKRAGGIAVDYPNDLWDIAGSYRWLGDGFQPSLGFVPRPGVQMFNFSVNYQPRPRWLPGVRQMFHEFQSSVVTDLDGKWESYRVFMAPINWRLETGDRFEFNVVPTGERLIEPFEIDTGVTLQRGAYHFNRFRLEGGLAAKRKFSGQFTWWFGDFYNGTLDQIQITSAWKPSSFFTMEFSGDRNIAHLPEGSFVKDRYGTRVRFNFSPDLQLNSYVQYDNETNSVGTNTRLRWTFSPLGELFVVYNHNMTTFEDRFSFSDNQLLVKLQYAFRY
jgi:hypothetical protein